MFLNAKAFGSISNWKSISGGFVLSAFLTSGMLYAPVTSASDIYKHKNAKVPSKYIVNNDDDIERNNFYVRGDLGWLKSGGEVDSDFNSNCKVSTYLLGGGLGYQFTQNIRSDITVDYGSDSRSDCNGDQKRTAAMANLYYDMPFVWITPYIGLGLGGIHLKNNATTNSYSAFTPAASGTLGLSHHFTQNWATDLNYRLLYTGLKDDDANVYKSSLMEHAVRLGVRYYFW